MNIDVSCKDCVHKCVCQYSEEARLFGKTTDSGEPRHPYFQKQKGRKVTPDKRRFALEALPHWAVIGCRFFWSPPVKEEE